MWVVPMKDLPNLLCQCQTAFCLFFAVAIDSCFDFLGPTGADNQVQIRHLIVLNTCCRWNSKKARSRGEEGADRLGVGYLIKVR